MNNLNVFFVFELRLYYSTTSCGTASFIAAFVAGVNIETEQVNLSTHRTASDIDFYTINSKGNVPCIVLDDGTVLNETAATLQYIASLVPGTIQPLPIDVGHYKVQNILSYVGTEVHQTIVQLFNPNLDQERRVAVTELYNKKLAYLNDKIVANNEYTVDNKLSIADIYLYIVLSWSQYVNIDNSIYSNLVAFYERVGGLDIIKSAQAHMATDPARSN